MNDWTEMRFGDLGQIFDGPHATPTRTTDGPYFLNISSLQSGRLNLSESDHVSSADFVKWTRRVTPLAGDLLFSYETRLGDAALMPRNVEACLGRRMALLRGNDSIVESQFLLYYYLGPEFQATIARNTIHGATVNRIPLSSMATWSVRIPPVTAQRAISDVLGALDDKIAANTQLAHNADALAATKFTQMQQSACERPLTDVAEFVNGRAFTRGASGTGRVVVRIAELNSGIGASTVFSDADVADDYLARPGDLLFAWSGSLTLHRWYRPEAIVNQHIFKVAPKPGFPTWLVFESLRAKLDDFKSIASDKATTMGHIQRHHLDAHVRVPEPAIIAERDELMSALWAAALSAEQESLILAETRDSLLVALLSGRLRVKDAEAVAESVL